MRYASLEEAIKLGLDDNERAALKANGWEALA